ncbi:MAG TPA: polynucleotide kinase-phosphatase [Herpetosiphonaceae bacterium]|nr:polynucleotide kinase-phosphatase [Herpetosiphonaceae bacterium]
MKINIPELALVVLVGASGSGKSTFARAHFKPTEVLSSDVCRGLVSDDENDQSATKDAFEVLHFIAAKRLAAGRLTVVDATNVQVEARTPLVALARQYHCLPVAIVLNMHEKLCHARNQDRPERSFGPHVVGRQTKELRRSLRGLQREGFRHVWVLDSPEAVASAEVTREPLWNNRKDLRGPFDIIGDVHGCFDELQALLTKLGYDIGAVPEAADSAGYRVSAPPGRTAIFLGDLVDRGPKIPETLRLVMSMVRSGAALCVPGNHDLKLLRKLRGKDVRITHGLQDSLTQLESETAEFRSEVVSFLDGLVSHYVLNGGDLVVAHAGMKEALQGRGSGAVREFALYGETTGETDEFGLPIRYNWAAEYRGKAEVIYGHTPVPEPEWLNRTINIDTGCVFGGKLTALRYPERELVSVPALHTYAEPAKPFIPEAEQAPSLTAQQRHDDLLDMEDVSGKRLVSTRLHRDIMIREGNATAALEVMSRFAADPRWLIYMPPAMSPSETTREPGLLEHPSEAFAYFRHEGVPRVICQEKHMGSRAVVVVCRDEDVARARFGVADGSTGICYTRTGRRFFDDVAVEVELLAYVRTALDRAGLWEELNTGWICLDCELMPWSAKAQGLLRQQYAPVGVAARASLGPSVAALEQSAARGMEVEAIAGGYRERLEMTARYVEAYRRYCWPVNGLADLKLAPFHLLASEGAVHVDKHHLWHMEMLGKLCRGQEAGETLLATAYKVVDVTDAESEARGTAWWDELTAAGGEGMVVKPLEFITRGPRGLVQPAVKCRGREYLRIIYGPEYTAPANLERLRSRRLAAKRGLALREFALGIEALERFIRHEPLRRVHECVFGVLALESEPVDPRL